MVPREAPFRGPPLHVRGDYTYACSWDGTVEVFQGEESISFRAAPVYRLRFHGGKVR